MEGVAGLSQRRISRLMGSSPSVTLRAIARHTGPDAVYLTEDARYGLGPWHRRGGVIGLARSRRSACDRMDTNGRIAPDRECSTRWGALDP